MLKLVEKLCNMNAPSGSECEVREFIQKELDGYAELCVTPLGSLVAKKLRGPKSQKNIMVDAHIDEVGIIITSVTEDGFARFDAVGGIEPSVMASAKVCVNGNVGVVMTKPVHFLSKDEQKNALSADLYIDFGADTKQELEKTIKPGDTGVICGDFAIMGENIRAKALDDRVGTAILIDMLKDDTLPVFTASFSVQEEVGLRGAKTSVNIIEPDGAIVLEGTTAFDVADVPKNKQVCALGCGPAVSFMDRATLYDKKLYDAALASGVKCQPKAAATGGNNAGAIHIANKGVPTLAISVPCRYIHSPSGVCNKNDIVNARELAAKMLNVFANGDILS
ncbi:MAG: M42 family peptidase [Clostridia bacterium]|nr:M42 family peptidase [Clostridia bacterium]